MQSYLQNTNMNLKYKATAEEIHKNNIEINKFINQNIKYDELG